MIEARDQRSTYYELTAMKRFKWVTTESGIEIIIATTQFNYKQISVIHFVIQSIDILRRLSRLFSLLSTLQRVLLFFLLYRHATISNNVRRMQIA